MNNFEEQAASEGDGATDPKVKDQLFNLSKFAKDDVRVEELRKVATQCVKASESRKQPPWGKADKRPSLWLSDIPWCVKTGLVNGEKGRWTIKEATGSGNNCLL